MSLQAILDAIHASGKDQVHEIETRAQVKAQEILARARIEAQRLCEGSRAAAAAPAPPERARTLYQARLEALQIIGDAREALIDAALCQTRRRLAAMRMETAYPTVFRRLTEEVLKEFDGSLQETQETRLRADPRDRELLEEVLLDLRLQLPTSYDLDCWGGLIAESKDGRVVIINTLEVRLERAAPYLRRYLAALFEDQAQGEIPTADAFLRQHPSLVIHPSSVQGL